MNELDFSLDDFITYLDNINEYEGLKTYDEAKNIYQEIIQRENYYTPGIMFQRVRVNLGNIYYLQGEYKKAITEWQRAVDKISKENKEIRGAI